MELDLVVFDLAGTTVEDHGQVSSAFASSLAGYGFAVTEEQIRAVRGASKRQAIFQLVPPGSDRQHIAEAIYTSFKTHLAQRYAADGVREIQGVEQVFRLLRERGVKVALNTGFDRDTTGLLLDALGWASGIVNAVVCGDDVSEGRPAPYLIFRAMQATGVNSVRRVANVGDTILDLQAGANAGVHWNVGVLTGAHDRQTLESVPHTAILPSVAELPSLWDWD